MKTILIDDEKLALEYLDRALKPLTEIRVIGKYTNPYKALIEIMNEQPEIVFLDIEIPEISGLDLAEKIKNQYPDIHIVFITSYDEYAVRAFEIGSLDYILKPVDTDRLENTVRRIMNQKRDSTVRPMVCCFQELRFTYSGDTSRVIDVKWRTARAKELFAYLVHNRNKVVPKEIVIEELWGDRDIKDKFSLLYNSIYHIRTTLESINFPIKIISVDSGYRIEMNGVLIDVEEWERGFEQLSYLAETSIQKQRKLTNLYQGDYFEVHDYFWANHERERLKVLWSIYMEKIGDYYIAQQNYSKAALVFLQFQKVAPYEEGSYFKLMKIYYALGDFHSVTWQYNMLTKMLDEEYQGTPHQSIIDWYEKIK